ncbi:Mu transposase C-terminal domain-containing protein [Pseudomonas matsuisoli]|uniref:Transposase n=1 Tax=Pseudomonas matsuisoli TaxID=1515666 RepID=A0A917PPG9_9PSED|nr:Mu transposase C-terminal domain-containing protein [Pseudomonas matsuisoli]GGJ86466.1 transposase [Pseudomonas matsuisoli]
MDITLVEGMPIIALGNMAFIIEFLPEGKLKIQLKKNREFHVVPLDEIEVIQESPVVERSRQVDFPTSPNLENISPESAEMAQERYKILTKCSDNEITIAEAAVTLNLSKVTIYKMLNNFIKENGVLQLIPHKRGRQAGQTLLDDKVSDIINDCIKKYYKGKGATARSVYENVVDKCGAASLIAPSYSTIQRRIRKLSPLEKLTATHGAEYAKDKLGLKPGEYKVSRPLERVQMDHTEVDIFLSVDGVESRPVRPWLTVAVDVYTRVILGFYLALHSPSAVSVAATLSMACFTKTNFLNSIGANSAKYPFYGKPKTIFLDNAAEFRSPKFVRACAFNDIAVEWRPKGKKHWGGIVERLIGTLMRRVHSLPGTTMSNVQQRGKENIKASVTFERLLAWLALEIESYHNTPHKGLDGRSPANVWFSSFKNDRGNIYFPPIIADPFRFKLDFMPEERRNITPKGVQLKRNFYSSPALALHVGKKDVIVKYDPFSMKKVWVYINGEYIEADYGLTRPDMSLAELNLLHRNYNEPAWLSKEDSSKIRADAERLMRKKRKNKFEKKTYELANSHIPPLTEVNDSETESIKDENTFTPTIYPVKE